MADPGVRLAGSGRLAVARSLLTGEWRDARLRLAAGVLALALGLALMVAIFLVNASALDEFDGAVRRLAGGADLIVRGPREGFDEALYPRLRRWPGVRAVSPELEIDAALAAGGNLRVYGLDPFRVGDVNAPLAAALAPHVLGLLRADAIVLSAGAARALCSRTCESLSLRVGAGLVRLRVIGVLSDGALPGTAAVMDIGSAQWALARTGRLSLLKVRAGDAGGVADLARELAAVLPAGVWVETPDADSARTAAVTRAYRLNLNLLALVALLTGAFLVYATAALSVERRRPAIGLVRALGAPARTVLGVLLAEGAVEGLIALVPGLGLGVALATLALAHAGADLGGGYFRGAPALHLHPLALAGFAALTVVAAALGAVLPARRALGLPIAAALRATAVAPDAAGAGRPLAVAGLGLIVALAGLALPTVRGLPFGGYVSIAGLLLGGLSLVPLATARLARAFGEPRSALAGLARAQIAGRGRRLEFTLGALLVSFSLMVAMAVMVHSFRVSFLDWLDAVLPADLNLRAPLGTSTAYWDEATGPRLRAVPGVAAVELRVEDSVALAPAQPPVALIARPLGAALRGVPLLRWAPVPAGETAIYVSEAVVDLYGWQPGRRVVLPLGGVARTVWVAGVWRDYARSFGAIVIDLDRYRALGGRAPVNAAQLWLEAGADAGLVAARVAALTHANAPGEVLSTAAIRARSVAIFDRAFALTYALLAISVGVGLLGTGFVLGAEVLARRAEFGLLRHLGLGRRDVLRLLAIEGGAQGLAAALAGVLLGLAQSLVLVYVVNRQSFHWSIGLAVPWPLLTVAACTLVAAAAVTARLAARGALGVDALRAVREDA